MASNINKRSQQQASELLRLKRSAQQAAFHLRRQGVHTHPQLEAINQFLEQSSTASVPSIERDTHGQFCLTHTAVNLNQAETEASDNAALLRRHQPIPFSQPVANGPGVSEYLEQNQRYRTETDQNESYQDAKHNSEKYTRDHKGSTPHSRRILTPLRRYIRNRIKSIVSGSAAYASDTPSQWLSDRVNFSLTDGTIWFASAVIIRILLNALIISYPFLQMPLLLILVGIIAYSIYRIVLAKSTDTSATYRIGSALLGLFFGSTL